ncbi:MAG: phosphoethanolamine transferase domain-containing protein [Burkholderiaceae bacterium]
MTQPLYRPQFGIAATQVWWLRPHLLILLMLLPIYLSFLVFEFDKAVPNTYIPSPYFWWGSVLILALGIGAAMGSFCAATTTGGRKNSDDFIPAWVMLLLLAASLFAYAMWFYRVALNPHWIVEIISGERANLRDVVSTKPGVTTLTQCAVAYALAYAVRRHQSPSLLRWWETAGLIALFLLAAARVLLWSERLAIIEITVVFLIANLAYVRFRSSYTFRLVAVLPLLSPLVLYLAFTGTEYFRSWDFYRDIYSSIWGFSLDRLLAYYATASNNGIGLLAQSQGWPMYSGAYVLEWAYALPGAGPILVNSLGDAKPAYEAFLLNYGRPELNNPSGIFPIVFDLGFFGSAVYFLSVGFLIGVTWKAFVHRQLAGVLFYPIFFLFIIELLRFNYLSNPRLIPCVAGMVLILLATRFSRRERLGLSPHRGAQIVY